MFHPHSITPVCTHVHTWYSEKFDDLENAQVYSVNILSRA